MSDLGGLDEGGYGAPLCREIKESGLGGHIVIPDVVMHGLEIPHRFARLRGKRHHGTRVVVEAVALGPEIVRGCIARRHENQAPLGIGGKDGPGIRRTPAIENSFALLIDGLDERLTRRQGIPTPAQFPAPKIIGPHHPTGSIHANIVEDHRPADQQISDDQGGRSHPVFPGYPIPNALTEVDGSPIAKIRA